MPRGLNEATSDAPSPGAERGEELPFASTPTPTSARARRRLPAHQPLRGLTVSTLYLLALALAVGPVLLVFGTPLGWLILFAFAALLTVPVAIAAPRPRPDVRHKTNEPVLRRGRNDEPA